MTRKLLLLAMLAVIGFSLSGCVVYDGPYRYRHYDGYYDRGSYHDRGSYYDRHRHYDRPYYHRY